METTDRTRFAEMLAGLASVFQRELDRPTIELYFRSLADLHIVDVVSACERCLRELTFFPKPHEIRERAFVDFDTAKRREDAKAWPEFAGRPCIAGQERVKALVGRVLGDLPAAPEPDPAADPAPEPEPVRREPPQPPPGWRMEESHWRARWDMGRLHPDLLNLRDGIPAHLQAKFAEEDTRHKKNTPISPPDSSPPLPVLDPYAQFPRFR